MTRTLFLILLFLSHSLFAQVNLNQGLVAYYPFSGNANDASGNNNNPVFNNATLTTDRFGNPNSAYSFNGIDNYMQIPNSPSLNPSNQISICAWVKVNGFYQGTCHGNSIVMKGDADYQPGNYALRFDDNAYTNGQNCSSPVVDINHENFYGVNLMAAPPGYTPYIQTGSWFSVIYTCDGITANLYVNCELKISAPANSLTFSNSYDLFLGKMNNAVYPYWFNGVMDEVRIYNRALNQDEVNAYGGCVSSSCNNWLHTQAVGQSVTVGDLDVSGDQMTIEANFSCTSFPLSGANLWEDIVSKHSNATDINYSLRMDLASITTTTGRYSVSPACNNLTLNKIFHVALVYDGSSLKFYRNGFLVGQMPATGNLILNNWMTTIGDYAANPPVGTNFFGYINEVRIWNVARTQAEIRAYMNTSLPNPTTQPGLLGYYTFDNLLNKQGNPAYNGTLNGGATINNTVPDCSFTADSCTVPCNDWLSTPSYQSYVSVGDLDIPGDKITVEALINRTQPYLPGTGNNTEGDIVSKHNDPSNVNYLLRPNHAYITTTNGFFATPDVCDIELNKTYHIAMVYDGSTLKYYRDGFLMSSVPATGNLFQNNFNTRIGYYDATFWNTNFLGYINEVRIWNTARTQAEIRANMNSSLPNPTTQPGLLAYYVFNDLTNKQGNAAYNGTLGGTASINATNPDCTFIPDSCTSVSTIINDYTPVLALNTCDNKIIVEDASAFNVGDTVLLIQMKGAVIDSSNTSSFGTITDYKNSGNYEFNYVKSKSGDMIELKNLLTRQYDIPDGKVQLVRVPYYQNANITSTITCLPWDGSKGGIVALNVQDTLNLYSNIDVSGKGFIGGAGYNSGSGQLDCFQNNYNYPITSNKDAGQKGESITSISQNIICGKGNPAGGGGGGLGHNSGGGGGGNGGMGGFGGYQLDNCGSAPFDNRGIGGHALLYSSAANKIFMGGGGGAGQADNPGNIPSNGGNGGGIIIINANYLQTNSYKIISNGQDGTPCSMPPSVDCHDGMGGGGAGGSILLNVNQILDNTTIENKGGKGADMIGSVASEGRIGAGGGGSGGLLFVNTGTVPANITNTNTGGANGVLTTDANNPWGATAGQDGMTLFNLVVPIDSVIFKANIDSVKITDSATGCKSFDFSGTAFTNTNPITNWQWYFGDGGTSNSQDTSYIYGSVNTFLAKLIVKDINGCMDSISRNVTTTSVTADAGIDTSFCSNNSVTTVLHGISAGGTTYAWSPSAFLNDSTLQSPTATLNNTTKFFLTVSNNANCSAEDSITLTINPLPLVQASNDTAFCAGGQVQMNTTGASTYIWSPATGLNNSNIPNPLASPLSTTQYTVMGTDLNGCSANDTVNVMVNPKPVITKSNDTLICKNAATQLFAGGGITYSWSPPATLSDPNISNPVATPSANTEYYVTVTDANTCSNIDSVMVNVRPDPVFTISPATNVCENNSTQLTAAGGDIYSWQPATSLSNPNISNPIATPATTTDYSVQITETACNNSTTLTTTVTVLPPPTVHASKSNDLDCSNDASQLNATGAILYTWSPTETLDNPNIQNPIARPTTTTQYSVKGVDASGCSNTDTITVYVTGLNKGGYLMPNAFTPNNDGKNDCYGVKYWGVILELDFSIYNRWGQRIFHTNQPGQCWDGTFNGQPQNPDVYIYMIKAKTFCDQYIFRKGTFTLIR